jgi:hypothetical protein
MKIQPPNQSPEPTAVAAAVAIHVVSRRGSALVVRQHAMRKLLYILLATAALFVIRGYSLTDSPSTALSFYIVSERKIEGGRFIDTLDLPKLGYIAIKPDLIITQLVAVSETVSHSSMVKIDKDGNRIETPLPDSPALNITILPADKKKFEVLTGHSVGRRMLMMLGDVPLMAPTVETPVPTAATSCVSARRAGDCIMGNLG